MNMGWLCMLFLHYNR